MEWSWAYVANMVERNYGCYVDWDEEFYIYPECDEPIYKCDYPFIRVGMICPVCENEIEE